MTNANNNMHYWRLRGGKSNEKILAWLNQVSRDHSRLPMQWNDHAFAEV